MKVGISVECRICHLSKAPRGRSIPMIINLCDWECPGYNQDPQPGTLWPGETEVEFGYPVGPYGWREESNAAD